MTQNQNVQRLEGEIILPRVLGDLTNYDQKLLQQHKELILSGKYKGNTKELQKYKKHLPALSKQQVDFGIGLLLGDTTLQANNNGESFRLKTQQKKDNASLLYAKKAIFLPWVMDGISEVSGRPNMLSLQTITHSAFKPLVDVMHNPSKPLTKNACMQKKISPNIGDYLSPITIGAWFCGDGSKRDHGVNQGKAIQFHTQGFSFECCQQLANALQERYGWKVNAKFDYTNPNGINMYLVQVEAASFDSFMEIVEPYILPYFKKRLPTPRKENSRFKKL